MGFAVVAGAMLLCPFGVAPSSLMVLPASRLFGCGRPMANIMDQKPFVNIMPFGMCQNPANPAVAAATAAKLGVFTPMPCIPVPVGPWLPGCPKVLSGGAPALTQESKLFCAYGGCISITNAGQTTIQL